MGQGMTIAPASRRRATAPLRSYPSARGGSGHDPHRHRRRLRHLIDDARGRGSMAGRDQGCLAPGFSTYYRATDCMGSPHRHCNRRRIGDGCMRRRTFSRPVENRPHQICLRENHPRQILRLRTSLRRRNGRRPHRRLHHPSRARGNFREKQSRQELQKTR
jgi:hypothetical protein